MNVRVNTRRAPQDHWSTTSVDLARTPAVGEYVQREPGAEPYQVIIVTHLLSSGEAEVWAEARNYAERIQSPPPPEAMLYESRDARR